MRYDARWLGDLPHEMINLTLGLELAPGRVYLSALAHRHMATDHPADYPIVINAIKAAVTAPTFLGQAPRHAANFEVIKRVTVTEQDENGVVLKRHLVLVAICLEPDEAGCYRIVSGYTIKQEDVDTRRAAGRLHPPKNKAPTGGLIEP
jgi:hypothetical protein